MGANALPWKCRWGWDVTSPGTSAETVDTLPATSLGHLVNLLLPLLQLLLSPVQRYRPAASVLGCSAGEEERSLPLSLSRD